MPIPKTGSAVDRPQEFIVTKNYDWKPSPKPVPTTGICDFPCKCVKINNDWLPWIIPALLRVGHSDVWDGTPAEKQFAFEQVDYLIGMLMACDCGEQTGTPDNPTIITDVAPATTYTQVDIDNLMTDIQTTHNTYDINVGPFQIGGGLVDVTSTPNKTIYDDIVCFAVYMFLQGWRQLLFNGTQATIEGEYGIAKWLRKQADEAIYVGSVASLIGAVAVQPKLAAIGGFYAAIGAIGHELADWIPNKVTTIPGIDLGQQWVDDFGCYLVSAIWQHELLTFDKWREYASDRGNAYVYFVEAPGDAQEAEIAWGAWLRTVNSTDVYYSLVEMMDSMIAGQQAGLAPPPCPCCRTYNTGLLSLKEFPAPDYTGVNMWADYPGSNPFETITNYGTAGTNTFGTGSTKYAQNALVMDFDPPIQLGTDLRFHIIHQSNVNGQHTIEVEIDECLYGIGTGSPINTIFPWTQFELTVALQGHNNVNWRARRMRIKYTGANGQPLYLEKVRLRAALLP